MRRFSSPLLCWLLCASACRLAAAATDSALPPPMPAEQAFEDLKTNARTSWLIRLVAYDPAQPALRIDHLQSLGGPSEDYSFVADYAELRGYTAEQAAHLGGGAIRPGQHVSAIIFPLRGRRIYPASVRGMLQVVQEIDKERAAEHGYRPAPFATLLSPAELRNLADRSIKSWAWDNYRPHYAQFAAAFAQLKMHGASAIGHVGHIGSDWCEPGCSRLLGRRDNLRPGTMALALPDGTAVRIERFGVRVFLIRNLPLAELNGRMLIDFDDPEHQIVPYIALPGDADAAN
jgi:hypothetical protein